MPALSFEPLPAAPGPLAGTRILDLTDRIAAYGPKLLTSLGAETLLIEPPTGVHRRRRPPFATHLPGGEDAASLYFLHYDAGKQSVTLDVETAAGRGLLRRLLATVDVVVDNGALHRLGFDLDELARQSPPLVVVAVTPFGLAGARPHWQAGDLILQAMSGMTSLFGYRNERPARFGPEQAYELGGLAAALAALIGLYRARHTGQGEAYDIAIEQVCALVTLQMSNASIFHQYGYARARALRGPGLPNALYETRDGFVAFNPYRKAKELLRMLTAAGAAEDLPDSLALRPETELAIDKHVDGVVRRFCAARTRAEVIAAAQAHNMMGLAVNDAADLVNDPFLQQRAFFVQVPHPELGAPFTDLGPPIRFGATPFQLDRRPPLLGEHTAAVLAQVGVDDDTLAKLRAEGVAG